MSARPLSAGNASGRADMPGTSSDVLAFYADPGAMTDAGAHAPVLRDLPSEVGELVRIIQGLGIYDVVAESFYGCPVPEERAGEIHLRPIRDMLDRVFALDRRPLPVARPPERRLLGRCRHFALLLVAMLRARGLPARARCGFAAYLNPSAFEDHWVCEYWKAEEGRWALADAQLDDVWRARLNIRHDILDMPAAQFIPAAEAWQRCRAGEADPSRFGISFAGLSGLWFIAGDLVRDAAALNKVEMLPWDAWGAMPRPDRPMDADRLAFLDRLAALTRTPDTKLPELRALYDGDSRVRVPGEVFNALLKRQEAA